MATQCVPLDQVINLRPWEIPTLYSCDIWPVPHILVPFSVALYTKWPLFAFLMAGIWEIVEVLMLMLFRNFSLFFVGPEENLQFENLGQVLIDDWLIHGGIGTLLGWTFIHTFSFPKFVDFGEFWSDPYKFWYYVWSFAFVNFGFFFLYGLEVGDGFRLGVLLAPFIQGIFILLTAATEPWPTWEGYGPKWRFWLAFWPLSLALNISNLFMWFFSGAIQAWLISGIYFIILLIIAQVKWDWVGLIYTNFVKVTGITSPIAPKNKV